MSGLIESSEGNNKDQVSLSLQVFQDIYNQITGKRESLNRLFFEPHHIRIPNLEALHYEMKRATEQWIDAESSCTVSVRFVDGSRCTHSGFNRFRIDCPNSNHATEDLEIEYDFLVLLPKTSVAKPYKVTLHLRSTLGVMSRLTERGVSETERAMFYEFSSGTARLDISYVDLAVARNLEATVENWYKSLPQTKKRGSRKLTQLLARPFGNLVRICAAAACCWSFWYFSNNTIGSLAALQQSALVFVGFFSSVMVCASMIAPLVVRWMRRMAPLSAIVLNQADEDLLEQQGNQPIIVWAKTILGVISAIGIGLITGLLGKVLGF